MQKNNYQHDKKPLSNEGGFLFPIIVLFKSICMYLVCIKMNQEVTSICNLLIISGPTWA